MGMFTLSLYDDLVCTLNNFLPSLLVLEEIVICLCLTTHLPDAIAIILNFN